MATTRRGRRPAVMGAALALTTLAMVGGGARVASASPADSALADALFRDGKALEAKGKHAEACPKFVESYRLDPKVGTLLNMAACHEQIGKTGTAWGEFNEAAAEARAQKTTARETYATKHAAALEAKLSKVTFVTVDPADHDVTLRLDGHDLGSAPLGTPLPLDPGMHDLVAHADGRESYTTRVTVPVGPATQTVSIPHLETSTVVAAVVPVGAGAGFVGGQTTTSMTTSTGGASIVDGGSHAGSWHKPAAIASFIVGGVGLAVAGVFGGLALSKHSDANDECAGTQCSADGVSKQNSARTLGNVSTATAIVGGVGAVLGVVFLVTTPHDETASASSSPSQMWLRPSVARGGATADWGVSF